MDCSPDTGASASSPRTTRLARAQRLSGGCGASFDATTLAKTDWYCRGATGAFASAADGKVCCACAQASSDTPAANSSRSENFMVCIVLIEGRTRQPGCAPSARSENQTRSRRGGRSRAGGTKDVIAASARACSEEENGGAWKVGSSPGGAPAPTQQLAQAAHLACDETTVLESASVQCPPSACAAARWYWWPVMTIVSCTACSGCPTAIAAPPCRDSTVIESHSRRRKIVRMIQTWYRKSRECIKAALLALRTG